MHEIRSEFSRLDECPIVYNISCSKIRFLRENLGVAWIECPMKAALRIKEAGDISIGWFKIKVELLRPKPIQCFKCLAARHTFKRSSSEVDRRECCRKCGQKRHFAAWCKNSVNCPVCAKRELQTNHRAGGHNCPPVPQRRMSAAPKSPVGRNDRSMERIKCVSSDNKNG